MHHPSTIRHPITLAAVIFSILMFTCNGVHVAISKASLLSGGLTDCQDPSNSDCRRGAAGAAQILRELRVGGKQVSYFPDMDRQSAFVQMHPDTWGVNAQFFSKFGISAYVVPHSLFTEKDRNGFDKLRQAGVALPLLSNVRVDPTNRFWGFVERTHIENGIGFMSCGSDNQPNSVDCFQTAAVAVPWLRKQPGVNIVVLLSSETTGPRSPQATADSLVGFGAKVDAIVFTRGDIDDGNNDAVVHNGTYCVGRDASSKRVSAFDIRFTGTTVTSVTVAEHSIDISDAQRTPQFLADAAWAQAQANLAISNDPVVGHSTYMPPTRYDNYRICMGGECPIGAVFTNTMRWHFKSDVAFTPSGGIRGPGWAAGPVKVSDIWAALPFANNVCGGKMMGLRLWELMNASYGLATFVNTSTEYGDRLLQVSGMRVRYAKHLPGHRVLSIDVFDRANNSYVPLDRTKVYSWAADSFLCGVFQPFAGILQSTDYEGEEAYTMTSNTVQTLVGDYLSATSSVSAPYNTAVEGRMVCEDCDVDAADTAAVQSSNEKFQSQSMRWKQEQGTCEQDTKWVANIATCVVCPEGTYQPTAGETECIPKPPAPADSVVVVIVVPIVCVLAIVCIAWGVYNEMVKRKNVRNVANAPKDGQVTLLFTDIQSSTKLWSTCPQSMSVALDIHHAVIRECIANHRGYEVKTVGDSFMIAVGSVSAGVAIARDIQTAMMAQPFPAAIDATYACEDEESLDAVVDDEKIIGTPSPLWNGIRVRIGIHTGEPDVVLDEVTKGYDYYGPPTNVAARVESIADGGQICMTRDVERELTEADRQSIHVQPIGAVMLKGVSGKTEIIECLPNTLRARTFAKSLEDDVETDGDGTASDFGSNGSMQSIAVNEHTGMTIKVLKGLTRTMRPKDKSGLLELLGKSWRIHHSKGEDDLLDQVGRRVALVVKKDDPDKDHVVPLDGSTLLRKSTLTQSVRSMKRNSVVDLSATGGRSPLKSPASRSPLKSPVTQSGDGDFDVKDTYVPGSLNRIE